MAQSNDQQLFGSLDYHYESRFSEIGYVIGVDEAGRGPWAGPVCAAAFWIHPDHYKSLPDGLTDSKKISATKRHAIEQELITAQLEGWLDFEAATSAVDVIDDIGILKANFLAMAEATNRLAARLLSQDPLGLSQKGACQIAMVSVDGNLLPELDFPAEPIIKGDGRILSIAAASIIAKQTRDAIMADLHKSFPFYGWDSNQGYGTKAHQEGLDNHGVCEHHRTSFAPIKKRLGTL